MKPGIYADIPNATYHAGPGISKSGLDLVARSPLHYWNRYLNPDREPVEPTPAMQLGTAIHTAVLEPDRFADEYAIAPKVDRRTKDGKSTWEAFQTECLIQKRTPISADDYAVCAAISRQLHHHPAAAVLFKAGIAEQSVFWNDPDTGVLCKCRPDWLLTGAMVDVKSTRDASRDAFARSVVNYDYHVQAAWYLDGIAQATGEALGAFIFAAYETDAPYAVAFYHADADMIALGRQEYRRRLRIYADALAANRWPGYPAELSPLSLPTWVLKAANDNNER
jgi:exodeoxyribonuclease VIII